MSVTGFSHVNVNCADFDASFGFYAETLGLPVAKKFPERFDTGRDIQLPTPHSNRVAVLSAGRGAPAMELIEWRLPSAPPPLPDADGPAGRAGLRRLRVTVTDLDAVAARLPEAERVGETVLTRDPDGNEVEVATGAATALAGVVGVVADLDRTLAFYRDTLGLAASEPVEVADAGAKWREAELALPAGAVPFQVTLREHATTSPSVVPVRRGDTVGLFRLAFLDSDVDGSFGRAVARDARVLTPPQRFDFGRLIAEAAMWFDPDGVLVEVLRFRRAEQVAASGEAE